MRTAIQYEFGGPEVLRVVETDRPVPGPGEVVVRVAAASVSFGEVKVRTGLAGVGAPPFTLGSDLSGAVAATGPGVTGIVPGQDVYGIFFIGTYAEYVAVPAAVVAPKPAGVDHVHAAALPVAALTAWQAVTELAQVTAGQRILIHAASGGVGHLAVQLAKLRGAHVVCTARPVKHDFLRSLGADELIDYTTTDFVQAAQGVDVVFDLIGGDYGPRSVTALRPGGLLLGAALDTGVTPEQVRAAGRRYAHVSVRPSGADLATHISPLVAGGRLTVHVDRTFPLAELPAAHEYCETGHVTGKVVITL